MGMGLDSRKTCVANAAIAEQHRVFAEYPGKLKTEGEVYIYTKSKRETTVCSRMTPPHPRERGGI